MFININNIPCMSVLSLTKRYLLIFENSCTVEMFIKILNYESIVNTKCVDFIFNHLCLSWANLLIILIHKLTLEEEIMIITEQVYS